MPFRAVVSGLSGGEFASRVPNWFPSVECPNAETAFALVSAARPVFFSQ